MPQLTGIRDGHRVTITVTGRRGAMTVTRQHHPDCPCRAPAAADSPCGHCLHTDGHHIHCPHF